MIIWCADANGKLGREEEHGGKNARSNNAKSNIIGPYARAGKQKRECGENTQNLPKSKYDSDGDMGEAKISQEWKIGNTNDEGHGERDLRARN